MSKAITAWKCTSCWHDMDNPAPRFCPNCGYTVYRPVFGDFVPIHDVGPPPKIKGRLMIFSEDEYQKLASLLRIANDDQAREVQNITVQRAEQQALDIIRSKMAEQSA